MPQTSPLLSEVNQDLLGNPLTSIIHVLFGPSTTLLFIFSYGGDDIAS